MGQRSHSRNIAFFPNLPALAYRQLFIGINVGCALYGAVYTGLQAVSGLLRWWFFAGEHFFRSRSDASQFRHRRCSGARGVHRGHVHPCYHDRDRLCAMLSLYKPKQIAPEGT